MLVPETDLARKSIVHAKSTGDAQDLSDEDKLDLIERRLLDTSVSANDKCAFISSLVSPKPVPVTVAQSERAVCWSVWQKTGGHCTYCHVALNPFERMAFDGFTIDHVIPRSRGGSDELENLVPACRRCNSDKQARTPEEWRGCHD